jgi:hypothetical protein
MQRIRILLPTSLLLEKPDPWELENGCQQLHKTPIWAEHTNDEGNHRGSISSRCLEALDQLLDLPDFDVLLGLVGLGVTHIDGGRSFKISIFCCIGVRYELNYEVGSGNL